MLSPACSQAPASRTLACASSSLFSSPCSLFPASRFVAPVPCFLFPSLCFPAFQFLAFSPLLPVPRFQLCGFHFHTSRSLLLRSSLLRFPCFSGPVPPAFLVQFHASSFQFLLPGPCLVLASSLLFNSALQSAASSSQAQFLVSSPLLLVLCFQILTFRSLLPGPVPCFQFHHRGSI